jgi:flagellar motor protein MotB
MESSYPMSNETSIGSLSGGISDEDAKLVDSILNDLGQGSQQGQGPQQAPQQAPQQGQMSPQQQQQMAQQQMAQQQMAQQQQQLQHQQQMAQQQMAQQQMAQHQQQLQHQMGPHGPGPMVAQGPGMESLMDDIKGEAKSIVVVIFLSILLNLDQVNDLFKKIALFVSESGALNMQCVFTKALLIGSLFFVIKSKLL